MDDRIEAEKAKTLNRVLTGDIMFPENLPSGHRKRLREKFIKSGLTGFADYEVVELLLSLGTPRKDCKPLAKEAIKVIYLTSQNQIIDTTDLFEGTVNSAVVVPRQIVEQALAHHAAALIFAHNHPTGICEPSKSDKDITRDLVFAGGTVQIKILDHLIIGNNRYYSFAGEGLISQYEMEFLGLKMNGGG